MYYNYGKWNCWDGNLSFVQRLSLVPFSLRYQVGSNFGVGGHGGGKDEC